MCGRVRVWRADMSEQIPSGMPPGAPEPEPLGVPDGDETPEPGPDAMPGIPSEGEPPDAG
jgi:hypothetical protein